MKKAAKDGKPHSIAAKQLSQEQTWMRTPELQAAEEFALYKEMFPYANKDIAAKSKMIIAEGAGFPPEIMASQKIAPTNYFCLVPTEDFQRKAFTKRSWSKFFLIGCKDKTAAFNNWMQRDVIFGQKVLEQAQSYGYPHILVDGVCTIEENYKAIAKTFGFQ